jgi:hypothetical protein
LNPWLWLPIGLAIWFGVALAGSLVLGPVLRRRRIAMEQPPVVLVEVVELPEAEPEDDDVEAMLEPGYGEYDEGAAERAARIVERNGWRRFP